MNYYLDLSLGPVQGFVAQSRRTRDLWGSSYLLSFLSAHALHRVRREGATIVRPSFDMDEEPMLRWVAGKRVGDPPLIGSVPNHFVVKINDEAHAQVVAVQAKVAIDDAWATICTAVWNRFIEIPSSRGADTAAIWKRQIAGFWEFLWVASPDEQGLLRRRKYWRDYRLPDEPGDKCMVMPELQELSGYVAARGEGSQQRNFWTVLRNGRGLGPLDLGDEERLSAVALVKRLYPKIAAKALGWKLDTSHWPSTVYVGALPWIREIAQTAPEAAGDYARQITTQASGAIAEKRPMLAGPDCEAAGDFAKLDANYFHVSFLTNSKLSKVEPSTELVKALRNLQNKHAPSTFYAILLADGDKLGDIVKRIGAEKVGEALGEFTGSVREIVGNCDGVTIYAGGDDVLAMLPVPLALECAQQLADCYRQTFERRAETGATLSASVVFAHIRVALRTVLAESRHLLDDIAKDQNGRDSLSVAVLKRGGLHCEWTSTWNRHGGLRAVESIDQLAKAMSGDDDPGLSATLTHRLHGTLSLLCGWPQWRPGRWSEAIDEFDTRGLFAAEVRRSLDGRIPDEELEPRTEAITDLLVELIQRSPNRDSDTQAEVGVDALLLARFLATGGAEEASS